MNSQEFSHLRSRRLAEKEPALAPPSPQPHTISERKGSGTHTRPTMTTHHESITADNVVSPRNCCLAKTSCFVIVQLLSSFLRLMFKNLNNYMQFTCILDTLHMSEFERVCECLQCRRCAARYIARPELEFLAMRPGLVCERLQCRRCETPAKHCKTHQM